MPNKFFNKTFICRALVALLLVCGVFGVSKPSKKFSYFSTESSSFSQDSEDQKDDSRDLDSAGKLILALLFFLSFNSLTICFGNIFELCHAKFDPAEHSLARSPPLK